MKRCIMAKELYNIALCYHGMTANENERSVYITFLEDFKGQINHLEALGYKFVKPSEYYKRYHNLSKTSFPVATIIFDDALESISMATVWLAKKSIPFGIAVIGQRLGKLTPEEGYASWNDLNTALESGLCEILHHTYNMHHYCLKKDDNKILNSPILEGPCYVDHGDFIYIVSGDTSRYFDLAQMNKTAWAFPLFGTDIKTDKEIKSTVKFKADTDLLVDRIRLWTCLHHPYSSGYRVKVQIRVNGIELADSIIEPQKSGSGSGWPESEFVTIQFDEEFNMTKGKSYEIEFITQNKGNASFMIYSIPDFSGNFKLNTTCTEMTFPQNIQWPARAAIILADNNGKTVTANEFMEYLKEDLNKNNQVIQKYLGATWLTKSTGYQETDELSAFVLGGTYSNGEIASSKIMFHAKETFSAEILRFKYAGRLGKQYPLVIDIYINNKKVGSFEANWWDWHWQEVEIDSTNFMEGRDYVIRFDTKNASPFGQGLVRVYMQQPKSPRPVWSPKLNKIVLPSETEFEHEALYEVSNPEGTDVFPDGAAVTKDSNFKWLIYEPYDGPGKVFLEILTCSSGKVGVPKQICYPFGAYDSITVKSKLMPEKEDIHPDMKSVLTELGIKSGFSVWDSPVGSLKNSNLYYSEYIMPRYLIEGDMKLTKVIKNIDKFTGYK
jgi:hypothetical protein